MLNLTKTLQAKRDQRFKDGVWQYLIDHSGVMPNGSFKVVLYVKTSSELWRRIEERIRGNYARYNVQEEEDRAVKQSLAFKRHHMIIAQKRRATRHLYRNGSPWQKMALWLYQRLEVYLFPPYAPVPHTEALIPDML